MKDLVGATERYTLINLHSPPFSVEMCCSGDNDETQYRRIAGHSIAFNEL